MEELREFCGYGGCTTSKSESISPTKIEEDLSTAKQVQVGQSIENPNDNKNPSLENLAEMEEKEKHKKKSITEEVLSKTL
jgi:hypothetical protein